MVVAAVAVGALPAATRARAEPAAERAAAPPFERRDLDGRTLRLEELLRRGPVLLDFWATWCKPCLESIPALAAMHRELGPRGLTVVGVSVDAPRNWAKVRPFARRLGVEYPVAIDEDGRLQRGYHVRALPTAVLIAPDGRIARVHQGHRPGEGEALRGAVLALLAAADTSAAAADTLDAGRP